MKRCTPNIAEIVRTTARVRSAAGLLKGDPEAAATAILSKAPADLHKYPASAALDILTAGFLAYEGRTH